MISDYQLGEAAYESYAAQANLITLPFVYRPWDQLTDGERQCWTIAALKVKFVLCDSLASPITTSVTSKKVSKRRTSSES